MKTTVKVVCPTCKAVEVVEVTVKPGQLVPETIAQPHLICPDE